jgi:hypothetical protein
LKAAPGEGVLDSDCLGEGVDERLDVRAGHRTCFSSGCPCARGDKGEGNVDLPSSILGELEILSIISSSPASASDSAPSFPSAPPFCCPFTPFSLVPFRCACSIALGSSVRLLELFQASANDCSSECLSSMTEWIWEAWWGAMAPCLGCFWCSAAEGLSWSCRSIVSARTILGRAIVLQWDPLRHEVVACAIPLFLDLASVRRQ